MNDHHQPASLKAVAFRGNIHLIQTDEELAAVSANLMETRAFGFDTETRPSFKKGETYKVSLLQLASETDAYVIRLKNLSRFGTFKLIFENPATLKIGAAVRDDIKQLQRIFNFKPQNFIELQDLAKAKGLENFGLKGMTAEVLGANLSKASKLTNWDARDLTRQQITYAATDAWIGLQIYTKLVARADN